MLNVGKSTNWEYHQISPPLGGLGGKYMGKVLAPL
jgi:hypothetical protein